MDAADREIFSTRPPTKQPFPNTPNVCSGSPLSSFTFYIELLVLPKYYEREASNKTAERAAYSETALRDKAVNAICNYNSLDAIYTPTYVLLISLLSLSC
jgi:hypothetical protein